jgi:hypothetical protein
MKRNEAMSRNKCLDAPRCESRVAPGETQISLTCIPVNYCRKVYVTIAAECVTNLLLPRCALLLPGSALQLPHIALLLLRSALLLPHSTLLLPRSALLLPHSTLILPRWALVLPRCALLLQRSALLLPQSALLLPRSMNTVYVSTSGAVGIRGFRCGELRIRYSLAREEQHPVRVSVSVSSYPYPVSVSVSLVPVSRIPYPVSRIPYPYPEYYASF